MRRLRSTIVGLVALAGALGPAAAADAATITSCTRAAVVSAVTAGGSHTFACDGRIVMSPALSVATTVTFDAAGRDVTFAGARARGSAPGIGEFRVVRVTATGALTLRGIDLEDGVVLTSGGADGRSGTGTYGLPAGSDGAPDATAGTAALPGRGGCALVDAGGRLVLRDLTVRWCQAGAGHGGAGGRASGGGSGGGGTTGRHASSENPGNGGPGSAGQPGGNGALPVGGVAGSPGQGGAIYSAGALDVADVRFEDNAVRGGAGGEGGWGGDAGAGGRGGHGGHPYGSTAVGGDGGNAGPPGTARPGGLGGKGGPGQGGGIYAVGATSIVRAHFARNTAFGGRPGLGGDGGYGAGGQYGLPGRIQVGGVFTDNPACNLRDGYWYKQCGRPGTSSGSPGGDGGANGDAGDALGGAVFFEGVHPPPLGTTNEGNRVVPGGDLADECASVDSWRGCATGGSGGTFNSTSCGYTWAPYHQPRCPRAPDGGRGTLGGVGRAESPDVGSDQGDGLRVVLEYDGDDVPGHRLPLDENVPAQVVVSVAGDAQGPVQDIAFDEGGVLSEPENDVVDLTVPDPPAPFRLAPGASRTFDVTVRGRTRGTTALRTKVAGEDALGRTAEAADREVVRVGEDLEVDVALDDDSVDLELDAATGRPAPKPVTITVGLENVSGEALTDARVVLRRSVLTRVARNPSAPFPLQVTALAGEGGAPDTPLEGDGALTVPAGTFAVGQKRTLTFRARAADKAQVEVRADASATAAGPRTVVGSDRTTIAIAQPALLALSATGPLTGARRAGTVWTYGGHIENLSPDEEVTVLARADRRGNVVEGQLDRLGDPDACGCGIAYRLDPGERMPYHGALRGRADGSGRGTVDLKVGGVLHTLDAEGRPVDVPVAPAQVAVAPGADRRTVDFTLLEPVAEPISIGGVAWLVSDSAARAFGSRVTGAQESAAGALAFARSLDGAKLSVHLQGALAVIREEAPEAFVRARDEMAATLTAFDDQLDSRRALQIATEVWGEGIVAGEKAWEDATWQDLSTKTGALLGSNAPELALEAILPGIAACKLLKYGGKTAFLRRAAKLAETKAARILAKGRLGLLPGDTIDLEQAFKLWGIDERIDASLRAYAKAKNVIIAVRDRSPGSVRRLAEGMLPKWEKVKAKNVNELDVEFLGFARSHLDTAMLKQMPEESVIRARIAGLPADRQAKVLSRWEQRKKEWEGKDRAQMEGYEQKGVIPKPSSQHGLNPLSNGLPGAKGVWVDRRFELTRPGQGVPPLAATTDGLPAYQPRAFNDGAFRAMTGDMDPIAILDAGGGIPSLARRLEIYRDLARMGFQHPESLTWDDAAGRAKYLFDYDLANGKADALLAYGPDGNRYASFFDSRKSVLGDTARGFMALLGVQIAIDAPGIVAGDVPLPEPAAADDDDPVYLTPGGDAGAVLSAAPDARLIRRNLDGTFSEWTRERGWQPYALPAGQTVTTVPQTSVRTALAAGQTRIDINERDALILAPGAHDWFVPGDLVVLDPGGPNEEFVTVAALGSIISTEPLRRPHRVGEMVAVVPRAAPGPEPVRPPAPPAPDPGGPSAPPAPAGARPSSPASAPLARPPATAGTRTGAAARLSAVRVARRLFSRRRGTTLTFRLDRAATVRVSLRRAGTRRARTLRFAGRAGVRRAAFGRGLRPGRWTATLTAGGNTVRVAFTVRR